MTRQISAAGRQPSAGVHYLEIASAQEGQRLDNFLLSYLRNAPRSLIYRLLRKGQVRVNGGRVKPTYRISAGDKVRIPPVPGATASGERHVPRAVLDQVRAAIVHEDHHQLVVNKAAGLAVHAGTGVSFGLIDAIRQLRPGREAQLVHRLDRGTSGLVLLALSREALREQQLAMQQKRLGKYYMALIHGRLREEKVLVDAPLLRTHDVGAEESVVVDEAGKAARTEFRLVQYYRHYTLVEARLGSGRTHQIRAHAAHMGWPLAGDRRYASEKLLARDEQQGLKRMFLHAHRLDLDWPEATVVSAPMGDDLNAFLTNLPTTGPSGR